MTKKMCLSSLVSRRYFLLYVLIIYLSISSAKPASNAGKSLKSCHCRHVSPKLKEVIGDQTSPPLGNSKQPVKKMDGAVRAKRSESFCTCGRSLDMMDGLVPIVDFAGMMKNSQAPLGEHGDSYSRLARKAQGKLQYIWNKLSKKSKPTSGNGSLVHGTEKVIASTENVRDIELPLTLQIGEQSTKA